MLLGGSLAACSSGGYRPDEDSGVVDAAGRLDAHRPPDGSAGADLAPTGPVCTPAAGHRAIAQLVTSGSTTCVLYKDGHIGCWGQGADGELGDGQSAHANCGGRECALTPVAVQGIADAVQISLGGQYACAVHAGGTVSCWGFASLGNLGDGTQAHMAGDARAPVDVVGLNDAVQVAAGMFGTTCAVRSGGAVVCWGNNDHGQLGDGIAKHTTCAFGIGYDCSLTPVPVKGLSDAVELGVGESHACARRANGHVVCWGDNSTGQLGDATTASHSTPAEVVGLTDASSMAVGFMNNCAARQGGQVVCWGYATDGQLGDGKGVHMTCPAAADCSPTPVVVSGLTDARSVSEHWTHACALRADQSVVCWGDNMHIELGDGMPKHTSCPYPSDCSDVPVSVHSLSSVVQLSTGGFAACALQLDCNARCWGMNSTAQLGDMTTMDRPLPVWVSGI